MAHSNGILVVGMHRSGTSAMSGALQRLGVALGGRLVPGAGDNPKGYFEHERVVAIHEELFRALGSWWYDPRPLPGGWVETPAARRAGEALVQVLREDFSAEALWAVKDPRLCRFLPLWRQVLDRLALPAVALLVLRAPGEVAASLTARNGFGPELGELLWLRHVFDSVRDTAGLSRTVILYEDLVADPARAIDVALGSLGIPLPTADRSEALAGFIETRLQHHSHGGETNLPPLSALARRVFESFRGLAHGGASWVDFEAHLRDFDQFWAQVGPGMQAMADAVFPEIEANARLSAEMYALRAELNAQLGWAGQVVEQHRALSTQGEMTRESLAGQRDALESALAHARSDLDAQVRWAEAMISQRDELRASLIQQRDELQAALAEARARAALDRAQIQEQREQIQELRTLERELAAMKNTFSWRITRPLRALRGMRPAAAPAHPHDDASSNDPEVKKP